MKTVDMGIEKYLSENRNFLDDVKNLVQWMNTHEYAPVTIHSAFGCVKKFFSRHGLKISDEDLEDMKILLGANVVSTQDEILTKNQLQTTMNYLSLSGKAVALFLISTGARIGETMQLKMVDLDLNKDPPTVNIRASYTKKGVGGRVMWFSYEAREAIKAWLTVKNSTEKRNGKPFPEDMVFGFSDSNFMHMWHDALARAKLDKKDPTTGYRIYHVHTLRKFFSTQMSIAHVEESIVHAWMGHSGYLDGAYKRYGIEYLAKMYLDHMDAISIYGTANTSEFTKKLEAAQKESTEKKKEIQSVTDFLDKWKVPNGKPLVDRLIWLDAWITNNVGSIQEIPPKIPEPIREPLPEPTAIPEPKPIDKVTSTATPNLDRKAYTSSM